MSMGWLKEDDADVQQRVSRGIIGEGVARGEIGLERLVTASLKRELDQRPARGTKHGQRPLAGKSEGAIRARSDSGFLQQELGAFRRQGGALRIWRAPPDLDVRQRLPAVSGEHPAGDGWRGVWPQAEGIAADKQAGE